MKHLDTNDIGKFLLRLAISIIVFPNGLHKIINGHEEIKQILIKEGLPQFLWIGVPVAEVVAPVLLFIGFLVRPAAAIIAFNFAMSIYLLHANSLFSFNQFGGFVYEINLLLTLSSLAVLFLGAGKYSFSRGQGSLQ